MTSLYIGPAVPTISLDGFPPDLQQLAICVNSSVQHILFFEFVVDLCRYLAIARQYLDKEGKKLESFDDKARTAARSGSKQKRTRNTWFISALLRERLNEAISDATSEYSIWQECYRYTGSLRGVVVLHTMLVNIASNQSKQEVLERISLWPLVGRMLFAILLSKLEMHSGITSELEFSLGHHMKEPPCCDYSTTLDKPSPNPNSGAELLLTLETQRGTGHKTVLAQVKGNQSHILRTLLSDPNQSQYDGSHNGREHEPRLDQTQARLEDQLRSGGREAALAANREGLLSNSNVTMGSLSSNAQSRVREPQIPLQSQLPPPVQPQNSAKERLRVDVILEPGKLCEFLWCTMSRKLDGFWREMIVKEARDPPRLFQFMELYKHLQTIPDKLSIILPPNKSGTGAAPKEPPVNIFIGGAMEFLFTKESTRHLVQSELEGDYDKLYTLTWGYLFKYLEKSLDQEELQATGLIEGGMITIFVTENKGPLFEMTIRVSRHLFRMMNVRSRVLEGRIN